MCEAVVFFKNYDKDENKKVSIETLPFVTKVIKEEIVCKKENLVCARVRLDEKWNRRGFLNHLEFLKILIRYQRSCYTLPESDAKKIRNELKRFLVETGDPFFNVDNLEPEIKDTIFAIKDISLVDDWIEGEDIREEIIVTG
jgi:hypothetical protein